ncbi:MAG: GNAT family N-acetyltransferase [Bacteroidota bacterium]
MFNTPTTQSEPTFRPDMLKAFSSAFGYAVELFIVQNPERQKPMWSTALFVRRRLGLTVGVRIPTLAYSPMALTAEGQRLLSRKPDAFVEPLRALSNAFGQVQLTLPPWFADVRPFQWAGWEASPLYTALIDLRVTDLEARWSASTRRTVRRHHAHYQFDAAHHAPDVVTTLLRESYTRQARPLPAPPSALQATLSALAPTDACAMPAVRAKKTGEIEACVALLQHQHTAHYWLAGSRPGPAMSVLLDRVWSDARSRGLHTFDFIGANTPSIAEFKRRLGGRLVPYYHVAAHAHPLLRWRHRLSH